MAINRPDTVTDFSQFTSLRAQARSGDDAAVVRKAAQQFEALFTQQMLKSARAAKLGNDLMGGGQTEFYQDMFDQQMSVHLSSGKGLGLADVLVSQLRGAGAAKAGAAPAAADTGSGLPLKQEARSDGLPLPALTSPGSGLSATPWRASRAADGAPVAASGFGAQTGSRLSRRDPAAATGLSRRERVDEAKATREAFVQNLWPHAERAGRELGVSPKVLIAQAALETGWGKHSIRDASGKPSLNFFGIKADKRWEGTNVKTTTTEFVNGQPQREQARFRAYDSVGASFDNYVDFLKSNPRYTEALRHGGDAKHFVHGLQKAGYATDPAYAQKILKIADGRAMRAALAATGTHAV